MNLDPQISVVKDCAQSLSSAAQDLAANDFVSLASEQMRTVSFDHLPAGTAFAPRHRRSIAIRLEIQSR